MSKRALMSVAEAIEFLPNPPAYTPTDVGWVALERVRRLIGMSPSGMSKMRGRFRHAYEHRNSRGEIFIFTPHWLRLWKCELQEMEN
jgi:hypothetical protein